MSPPRAVVFDCDGVLVDSEPHSIGAWLRVLGDRGHGALRSDVEACTGLGYGPTYAHIASTDPATSLPAPDELWPELLEALAASFAAGIEPFSDAADTVAGLAAKGVPMGVASSSPRERLDLTLGCSGLAGYFSATAAGDEVIRGKPAPDVYLLAAERLGVSAAECVAVEDTGPGAESAGAAGMTVVGVVRNPGERARMLAAGAGLVDVLDSEVLLSLLG
jgi:HAD superfamily hydrolase (TIGR01509 family)